MTRSKIDETITADVVVVGAGTSGLVTAVSAAEEGLDVVVVTASSVPVSRGGSNNAAYSKCMEANGIEKYSPEQIRKEIAMNYCSVDQKKWYKHYNKSEESMNWLIDIMAEAGYDCAIEQGALIPEGDIYYTAPSSHGFINAENQVAGQTQPFVVNTLADKLVALGGRIFFNTIGYELVRGGVANGTEGRVDAVIAKTEDGGYAKYVGTKAVVLATGDFSADRDMMQKYCPWVAKYIPDEVYDAEMDYNKQFTMNGLFRGDMHKAGLWVGAAWQKTFPNAVMGGTIAFVGTSPSGYDPHWGLMVDRYGKRYMNEFTSSMMAGRANWMQMGEICYAIWDRNAIKMSPAWYAGQGAIGILQPMTDEEIIASWESNVQGGAYVKADTIEELVAALGLPASTVETVERYNEMCEAGEDTDFYKNPLALQAIKDGPFYGAAGSNVLVLTVLGGLRTDEDMRVCDTNDEPIPGLYNVGTMVGDFYAGIYTFQMEGINYGACCDCFGYHCGKYIAAHE